MSFHTAPMKAFFRGNKLVLSRREEYRQILRKVTLIGRELERVGAAAEDRTTVAFPVESIIRIVDTARSFKSIPIRIPEEYIECVATKKDPYEYFGPIVVSAERERRQHTRNMESIIALADALSHIVDRQDE